MKNTKIQIKVIGIDEIADKLKRIGGNLETIVEIIQETVNLCSEINEVKVDVKTELVDVETPSISDRKQN